MKYSEEFSDLAAYPFLDSIQFESALTAQKHKDTIYFEGIRLNQRSFGGIETFPNNILFKNCYFEDLTLLHFVFEKDLTFQSCHFETDLIFPGSCTVNGILEIQEIFCKGSLTFMGGNFKKIRISFRELDKLKISGGKFEEMFIGYFIGSTEISDILILYKKDPLGEIIIKDYEIANFYITGNIENNKLYLEDISCRIFTLDQFSNSDKGSVKFVNLKASKKLNQGEISSFSILRSNLGKAEFYRLDLTGFKEVNIWDTHLLETIFTNIKWKTPITNLFPPDDPNRKIQKDKRESILQIKETYRQLKYAVSKQGDTVQEAFFYGEEMKTYSKSLSFKNKFEDKLVIKASKCFSNFGQSFLRPLLWLLFFHQLFLLILIYFFEYKGLKIDFHNPTLPAFNTAAGEYFRLLNPVHKSEDFTGWMNFWDIWIRVSSSFFIYNLIRATRKFIR